MTSAVWAGTVFGPDLWPLSARRHSFAGTDLLFLFSNDEPKPKGYGGDVRHRTLLCIFNWPFFDTQTKVFERRQLHCCLAISVLATYTALDKYYGTYHDNHFLVMLLTRTRMIYNNFLMWFQVYGLPFSLPTYLFYP